MENSNLHLKIREERIKQGLSQKELGEMVGLPQQAINRIEQGQRKLDVELFEKLCQVLKIKKIGSFSVNFISSYYQTEPIDISEHEQKQREEAAKKAPKFIAYDEKENKIEVKNGKPPKFTDSSMPKKEAIAEAEAKELERLQAAYKRLNRKGKTKAVERVSELTEIPRYTKPDEPPKE